ncbi:hypothetical protein DSO57_1018238 [Entomophthora muscae]|uniref:Uncharacterized protein n=1 Tax=Entomophthora muscae TaxID=34485 RepID=A0ACC2SHA0_9FUNG|nr:hypothetical protein DSO57_1018238 [Entomophthora muscae]
MDLFALFTAWQLLCTGILAAAVSREGAKETYAYLKQLEKHAQVEFNDFGPTSNHINCKSFSLKDAEYYATYAGLAYCKDAAIRRWDCGHCLKLGRKNEVSTHDNPYNKTRALLVVDSKRKEIVLAFRGTKHSLKNWWLNVSFRKTQFIAGKVHSGFNQVAQHLKGYYIEKLKSHLIAHPDYTLVITGHSLGGAAALLSAAILQAELKIKWPRIRLITYGQPRVGDKEFATWLNLKPLCKIRVVNEDDPVPHTPPMFMNFQHTHTEMFINRGRARICRTDQSEDRSCSNSKKFYLGFEKHSSAFKTIFGTV